MTTQRPYRIDESLTIGQATVLITGKKHEEDSVRLVVEMPYGTNAKLTSQINGSSTLKAIPDLTESSANYISELKDGAALELTFNNGHAVTLRYNFKRVSTNPDEPALIFTSSDPENAPIIRGLSSR